MARLPNPIEKQRLSGADKLNPQLYKQDVPKSTQPLGQYPSERSSEPDEVWFEISSMCIPGVLTGADRIMMEIASNLLAEYRTDPVKFQVGKYPHLISCLARFGMSPSDRTRLGLVKQDDDDEYGPL